MTRPDASSELIPIELIKDTGSYRILGPEDAQRYLRTFGVANCTALTLHFPKARIIALSHVLPSEDLRAIVSRIKKDLKGRISEVPAYFMTEGSDISGLVYRGLYINRTPQAVTGDFPGATLSNKIILNPVKNDSSSIDVMMDKRTGVVKLYQGAPVCSKRLPLDKIRGANSPRESDFLMERY